MVTYQMLIDAIDAPFDTHTVHWVCKLQAIELERYRAALQGSNNKSTLFLYSYQQISGWLTPGCPRLMPGPRLSSPGFGVLACVWCESYAASVLGVFLHVHLHVSTCVSRCPCRAVLFHKGHVAWRSNESKVDKKAETTDLPTPPWHTVILRFT